MILFLASFLLSAGMPAGQELPATSWRTPVSEALLTGNGDAYRRKEFTSLSLRGTEQNSIHDFAGSWVMFYDLPFTMEGEYNHERNMKRVQMASELQQTMADFGLVVIAVTEANLRAKDHAPNSGSPVWAHLDHPLFIKMPGEAEEAFPDYFYPGVLVLDPVGLIADGGTSYNFGAQQYTANPFRNWYFEAMDMEAIKSFLRSNPGLRVQEEALGSKLRKAIAKRKWKTVYSQLEAGSPLRSRVDGLVHSQLKFAERLAGFGDPISASARLKMLQGLPSDHPSAEAVAALQAKIKKDKDLKLSARHLKDLMKFSEKMEAATLKKDLYYAEKDFRQFQSTLKQFEKKSFQSFLLETLDQLKRNLELRSPHRPCENCGQTRLDCRC
ncbi:MAG: hypothetical protein DWQ01_05995 [Planctomycetota bacterium]|nr:MAG: hypothetical protein DWQ01_05995 [Planctomycetota bacterium]